MKQYFSFQWHITDECDQRCKHCYIFSENCNKKLDAMSWQQMQDTFYNCLDFCAFYDRLPYFYITGGDPILHPDFWKLLGLMKQHSVPFTILGNPFHLTDEVCRRLKEYGCEKYQLSIDGLRETHDWFRKPGSFDITLEKIGCINRAGIRSVVMTTVSSTNIDEVPGIIDAVVAAGANVFAFARYCPTSEEKDVGIEPLRYRKLLADCDKKFKEYEAAGCQTYFNKKRPPVDAVRVRNRGVQNSRSRGGRYDLRRLQLRQLPPDDPSHRGCVRLPPGTEQQGCQCVHRSAGGCLGVPDGTVP